MILEASSSHLLPALRTYEPRVIELDPPDVQFLREHPMLNRRILIRRPVDGDGYLVDPRQYAFVVPLPSGAVLRSEPRLEAASVLYMLATAYGLWDDNFLPEVAEFDHLDRLLEFVAGYFADEVEQRLEHGLYRSYVEVEENLPFVRGRIAVIDDLRENYVLRHRTFCRYSELTWDIPENQVIRQVVHNLSGWDFASELAGQLHGIDQRMAEVKRTSLTVGDIDRFTYHRLNSDYQQVHRLCRLFLEDLSLSEEAGEEAFEGFILDMNDVFEKFVTEAIRQRVIEWEVAPQEASYLGTRLWPATQVDRVRIIPDLLFRRGGRVGAVLDCKFKRTSDDRYKNFDFYQVAAYCTALRSKRGALIYPKSEGLSGDIIRVRNSGGLLIQRFAVELDQPPDRLDAEMDALAEALVEWADSDRLDG